MNEATREVIDLAVRLVIVLITGLLIPYLKSRTEEVKLQKTIQTIETVVKAAEQLLSDKTGKERYEYVVKVLNDLGIEVGEFEKQVIESAVYQLAPTSERNKSKVASTDSLNS